MNRLHIFTLVYRHRSVSKAARELRLTQPAVSQQLKKLERELRLPLFTRMKKRLVPTPAAGRLFKRVAPFLEELETEVTFLRRPSDMPYGPLRLGASPACGETLLPRVGTRFRFRFPAVTFSLHTADEEQLLDSLRRGELDCAVISVSGPAAGHLIDPLVYEREILLHTAWLLVCTRDYYLRKTPKGDSAASLGQLEFVTTGPRDLLGWWFSHHFGTTPANLCPVLETNTVQAGLTGIRAGIGAGVVPHHLVQEEIDAGFLRPIVTRKRPLTGPTYLVRLRDKQPSLTENAFVTVLKKILDQEELSFSVETGAPPPAEIGRRRS